MASGQQKWNHPEAQTLWNKVVNSWLDRLKIEEAALDKLHDNLAEEKFADTWTNRVVEIGLQLAKEDVVRVEVGSTVPNSQQQQKPPQQQQQGQQQAQADTSKEKCWRRNNTFQATPSELYEMHSGKDLEPPLAH